MVNLTNATNGRLANSNQLIKIIKNNNNHCWNRSHILLDIEH